jgi:hypothetical protein
VECIVALVEADVVVGACEEEEEVEELGGFESIRLLIRRSLWISAKSMFSLSAMAVALKFPKKKPRIIISFVSAESKERD